MKWRPVKRTRRPIDPSSSPFTYRQLIVEWCLIFAVVVGLTTVTPDPILNWLLFGLLAGVFVTEGVVMTYRVWRRLGRDHKPMKPDIAVIILVRFVLGLYFVWAAARQIYDPPPGDLTPEWLKFGVRDFVIAWGLLELRVIPYTDDPSRFSIVDLIARRFGRREPTREVSA